jgi:antitoxin (DNA-binding transcriptional repressor) of toxin-antitoxin stability system
MRFKAESDESEEYEFLRRGNAIARISPAKEKEEMSLMMKRMMADFFFN